MAVGAAGFPESVTTLFGPIPSAFSGYASNPFEQGPSPSEFLSAHLAGSSDHEFRSRLLFEGASAPEPSVGTICRSHLSKSIEEISMSTIQTLLALAGLIYVLCVIVQAAQEVFKALLNMKAKTMAETMTRFMGDHLPLADIRQALQKRGLNLTALEHFDKDDFRQLLDGIPGLEPKLEGVVASQTATFEQMKENVAANYEAARAAFQALYTRRNKLFAIGFSVIIVLVLNANIVVLYQEVGADQVMAQAIAGQAGRVATCPQAKPDAQGSDFQNVYQTNRDCIKKALDANPILVRGGKYGVDWEADKLNTILGLLAMCVLVSLGAPFWNDVLKGLAGINSTLNSNDKKTS
jgi:hypothetical protein